MLASAPGFSVPANITFQSYRKLPAKSSSTSQRSTVNKSEVLLHSAGHPTIDYIAREEEAESANGLLKHYVGIYDSQTETVRLVEVRKVVLRGIVRAAAKDVELDVAKEVPQSVRC